MFYVRKQYKPLELNFFLNNKLSSWWFISFWRSIRRILFLSFRQAIAIRRHKIIATMSHIIKPPIKNNNKTYVGGVDLNRALMQRFNLHNVRSYQIMHVIRLLSKIKKHLFQKIIFFIRNINLDLMIQEIRFHRILSVRLLSIF